MASPFMSKITGTGRKPMPPRPSYGATPADAVVVEEVSAAAVEMDESMAAEEESDPESSKISAGYVGPEQRCSSCMHNSGGNCELYGFPCDPEGGCPDHEPKMGGEEGESEKPAEVEIKVETD